MTDEYSSALDRAIDSALRDYMDVDASRAFQHTVLGRLERPVEGTPWWVRAAAASAFAAVLLVGVIRMEPGDTSPERERALKPAPARAGGNAGEPAEQSVAALEPEVPHAPPVAPRLEQQHTVRVQAPRSRRSGRRTQAGVATGPVPMAAPLPLAAAVDTEPLSPVEPIALPALDSVTIAHEEIIIPPLGPILAVYIEPLPPLGGGREQ